MDVLEVIVETNQQALCQTDVFGRNDNTQCESTQYENDNCDSCTDKYCFRIILGGIFYGDLEEGELEIGQASVLLYGKQIETVAEVMQELTEGYKRAWDALKE